MRSRADPSPPTPLPHGGAGRGARESHDHSHRGRRHRRVDLGAHAAQARHQIRRLRTGEPDPRGRRRHQHSAARDQGTRRARSLARARRGRHPHQGADLHQSARPEDLERAARRRCGLRIPAILHSSRAAAEGHPRRRRRRTRTRRGSDGHAPRRVSSGRRRRHRAFHRRALRRLERDGARRGARRGGRHPLRGATAFLSQGGSAELAGRDALARRDGMAAIPDGTLDVYRRRHGREARALSDRPRLDAGNPAHQLGDRDSHRRRRDHPRAGGFLVARRPHGGSRALRLALHRARRRRRGVGARDARSAGNIRCATAIPCRAGVSAA